MILSLLILAAWLNLALLVHGLKGDSGCGLYLCVNATVHQDTVTYELTSLKKPLGWVAIGFGRRMDGTSMVIVWQNEDGSTTLSQRVGRGHQEPLPVEYPKRRATLIAPRVTLWHPVNSTRFAFDLPANKTIMESPRPTEHLIWAYSMVRPGRHHSSLLTQHYSAGFFTLDYSKNGGFPGDAGESFGHSHNYEPSVPSRPTVEQEHGNIVTTSKTGGSLRKHEMIIVAHGVLVSFGFLVLLPAGSLIARWTRTLTPRWFRAHQTLNMLVALPIITIGWLLGPIAVLEHQAAHLFDVHQVFGVFLLLLYYLQVSLGRYIHKRRNQAVQPHPPSNILHVTLGLLIITFAFLQTRSGMEEWKRATGRAYISHWCHDLWNIWVVIIPLFYLSGTVLLPRQFHQERTGSNPGPINYITLSNSPSTSHLVFEAPDDGYGKVEAHVAHGAAVLGSRGEVGLVESSVPLLTSQKRT